MLSLNAVLIDGGIYQLDRQLDDLGVPQGERVQIAEAIAKMVTDALVRTGQPVVEDFNSSAIS
jgi:hypothetical protein